MQRFVEHRKQAIQESIKELDSKRGFERHFDILRLDLLDGMRLPESLCEHQDIFVETELRNLINQDYELLREFTENAIHLYKTTAYHSFLEEVAILLEQGSPIEIFQKELDQIIDQGIEDIQNQFKDILSARMAGLEDAKAGRSTTVSPEDPSVEPETVEPEVVPSTPTGMKRKSAPVKSVYDEPVSLDPSPASVEPQPLPQKRHSWAGQPDKQQHGVGSKWYSPPGGFLKATGRVLGGIGRGIADKVRSGARKIGDWWMDRPSTESTNYLEAAFVDSGTNFMKSILDFGNRIKQHVAQNLPKIMKDAGTLAASKTAAPANSRDPSMVPMGAKSVQEEEPETPQEREAKKSQLSPEEHQQADINDVEAMHVVAGLMGGKWDSDKPFGKAGIKYLTVGGEPIRQKKALETIAKMVFPTRMPMGERVNKLLKVFNIQRKGSELKEPLDRLFVALGNKANQVIKRRGYDISNPSEHKLAMEELRNTLSQTGAQAIETPEEKGQRLGATMPDSQRATGGAATMMSPTVEDPTMRPMGRKPVVPKEDEPADSGPITSEALLSKYPMTYSIAIMSKLIEVSGLPVPETDQDTIRVFDTLNIPSSYWDNIKKHAEKNKKQIEQDRKIEAQAKAAKTAEPVADADADADADANDADAAGFQAFSQDKPAKSGSMGDMVRRVRADKESTPEKKKIRP